MTGIAGRHLDRVLALLVAAEVVAIVAATSADYRILRAGLALRWLGLAALALVTAALLVRERVLPRRIVLPAALACVFVGLATLSSAWSAAPGITLPRAISVAALAFVAGGIAFALHREPGRLALQLEGLVAGGVAVALAGLVTLAVARGYALQPAEVAYPTRYRGFGGNPNTASLVLAILLPIALAFALRRGPRRRLHLAACVLFAGSIAPSASRGALLAAIAGALVVLLVRDATWRSRALGTVAVGVVALAAVVVSEIPKPLSPPPAPKAHASSGFNPNADSGAPLNSEAGYGGAQKTFVRSLTTSSGRIAAWRGALRQASDRIVLGYGFGTEKKVFVDRYPIFFSERVENAYIETVLELGLGGLALLLALLLAIAAPIRRVARSIADQTLLAGAAGAFTAGLVLATVQSYLFSVGGTGALVFWLVAGLLVALTRGGAARAG
jgi:O-antigen ligase